jgi:hypothetical protein
LLAKAFACTANFCNSTRKALSSVVVGILEEELWGSSNRISGRVSMQATS